MTGKPKIVIGEMGSQLTGLIKLNIEKLGFSSIILPLNEVAGYMEANEVLAIILSGSDKSVSDVDAPDIPRMILDAGKPILAICYPMQWLAKYFGGEVATVHDQIEYAAAKIATEPCDLFRSLASVEDVWANHTDSVIKLPAGAQCIATDEQGSGIKAMHFPEQNIWCVQFHPEMAQTPNGLIMFRNFVELCGCEPDMTMTDRLGNIAEHLSDPDMVVVEGFSGGVDSTTLAAAIPKELKQSGRLHCICVDAGQQREGEIDEIRANSKAAGVLDLQVVEAEDRFFDALAGVEDSEEKRRIFGQLYEAVFMEYAAAVGATHIAQGTLMPDLIESGETGGATIKSHHNVKRNWGKLIPIEPLKGFFKYQVRELAHEAGLPDSVVHREPFPGPGLFLRMPGAVTIERRDVLRWVDKRTREIVYNHRDCPEISQLVPYLGGTPLVGVKGEKRSYAEAAVVRPVFTHDYMTASSPIFSADLIHQLRTELTKHPNINRVHFDFTTKPPGSTEPE